MSMRRALRSLLIVAAMTLGLLTVWVLAGPLASGALFLAWPTGAQATAHDLAPYMPRHGGGVDPSTGLYTREDDDVWLGGTPSFVLRRTYRTRDRVSRPFGIGASNNAEWYLIGDTRALQWVQIILADGGRVDFHRVSWGTSHMNARFRSSGNRRGFDGAELGWMGRQWLLRNEDGSLAWFRDCPRAGQECSLDQLRDVDGHVVDFRRNARGRVEAIEAGPQSIRLEYDGHDRIVRAANTSGQHAVYTYDAGGRLRQAVTSDGATRTYEYGPSDDLTRIEEPGRVIQNEYDADGRVRRQVTSRTDEDRSWVYEFAYKASGGEVHEADLTEPDGTHTVYCFAARRVFLEIYDARGPKPVMVSSRRDRADGPVTELTVRCTANGRHVTRTAIVAGREEEDAKYELIARECTSPPSTLTQ